MTTMILAVMSRASLGHTGTRTQGIADDRRRLRLRDDRARWCVSPPRSASVLTRIMLDIAGALWGAALLLFLIVYRPILWSPRIGELL